jgi:hypothetical protein
MATSGVGNWFWQHRLQIATSIAPYIISNGMSVFGSSDQSTNLENLCLLTNNTPVGIKSYIECSTMSSPSQPMPNSDRTMFTNDSTCFDLFPLMWPTSRSPTSSTKCRSACLTISWCKFFTLWRHTNSSTSTSQAEYPWLLTTTSHKKIRHVKQFLNGMGRRWRKWTSPWLEC